MVKCFGMFLQIFSSTLFMSFRC